MRGNWRLADEKSVIPAFSFPKMGKGGSNCCIPGCTNYYEKTKGTKISYIGFPKKGCGEDEWRSKLIASVNRADKAFNPENAKICSVHFGPTCLIFHGKGFKLVTDSLPTLNMPKKSIEKKPEVTRKAPLERPAPTVPIRVAFLKFSDLLDESRKVNSPWVVLHQTSDTLVLGKVDSNYEVETKLEFQDSFIPRVCYKGSPVKRHYDVEIRGLKSLCKELDESTWCSGSQPRSNMCPVVVNTPGYCKYCEAVRIKQRERELRPLSANAPLCSASVPALIQEVKSVRSQLKGHEAELLKVQRRLATETVNVSDDVMEGLDQVMKKNEIEDPFLQLFWEEQQKAATRDPRGMRWHPMMIRFAIYLHYQSPRAYEALRSTGVLHLPNKSTLRDYTNFVQPKEGFQEHVFQEIKTYVDDLPPEKRYAALLHDEMSVRGDLVYDKRSGEIVGFVNPQTWTFKKESETKLATHVLVFMVIGVNSNLKKSLGYFATRSATADVLFPLLWEAVALLEQQGLKVITSTSDKASPNQKLYRLHGEGIVHQASNLYAHDEVRPLFFISDPPHLIKTIRNNLENSRYGGPRCMWNHGQHLLWSHIYDLYNDDFRRPLRVSKLRDEHVTLTPSSRMAVHLAAQVLSQSVGRILQAYYSPEASETARFILLVDEFFDCLNGRSFDEHICKRKPALAPYRDVHDPRFQFLQSFLEYLHEWQTNIQAREGFPKAQRDRMFLSKQTYEGIVTTVQGFTGATKYLLNKGVPYVFSINFTQDPLEEHFGRHRGLGMRSRNPSIHEFGYQENKLRIQRTLAFRFQPKGNTARGHRPHGEILVEEQPLPKIKRH